MSFQWPVDPQELFEERYPQMVNTGLPVADVDTVRAAVTDMWPDAPGGWVHEWTRLADGYAAQDRHDLAVLAYGWAKFPAAADGAKRAALERQVVAYEQAAKGFPVSFKRRVLTLPFRGGTTNVPVHILAAPDLPEDAPVVLASGGVDTWKMDIQLFVLATALNTGARVVAFDIPGTGESEIAMGVASTEVIDGLVDFARELGNGTVAHIGISMGGYFSARTGLAGQVDAALVLGGPVEAAFAPDREWRFGMEGIVGNALGFDHQPTSAEITELMHPMSLRPLLDQDSNASMLIVNGADDVHIPQHDTLVFEGRRDTEVHLLPDTGHCATSKIGEVGPLMIGWLTLSCIPRTSAPRVRREREPDRRLHADPQRLRVCRRGPTASRVHPRRTRRDAVVRRRSRRRGAHRVGRNADRDHANDIAGRADRGQRRIAIDRRDTAERARV